VRLRGWWNRQPADGVDAWKKAWEAAVAAPDASRLPALRTSLEALGLPPDDLEVEIEMLDGLAALCELTEAIAGGALPIVQTGHRVARGGTCHFSAPASAPDDPAQPAGRVIFTSERAVFAGGGSAQSVAWHAVADVVRSDRDLLLVSRDRSTAHRFRFNGFEDALCATALARRLAARLPGTGAGL
jgi:hypothetical protein